MLKAARVAIFTLGLLDGEARASRLSFADVVRRIAEQPETAPSFISKKVSGGLKQGGGALLHLQESGWGLEGRALGSGRISPLARHSRQTGESASLLSYTPLHTPPPSTRTCRLTPWSALWWFTGRSS